MNSGASQRLVGLWGLGFGESADGELELARRSDISSADGELELAAKRKLLLRFLALAGTSTAVTLCRSATATGRLPPTLP